MKNRADEHGSPICPVCDKPIAVSESTGHLERYMLHLRCWLTTDTLDAARSASAEATERRDA